MEVSPDTMQERLVIWIYTPVNEIPDIIFEHEEVPKVDSSQPQYMRRYSAHSLTEVFRAMGCQQPLSAALSDWMFNFLQHCPTNQLSAILGNGSDNLFSNQRTYSRSGQFVVLTRMQFHRLACASLHVHQFRKIRYSVDFRLTLDFMEDRRFFIILLSGAPGTGKSTMASLIASRMSVNHILSTDSIRHAMRTFYPKEKYPILYKSTYECGDVVDPDHKMSETERCIKGYQEQSDLVGKQLISVIKSFVDLRSSLIVEGVHLSISVMLNLVQQFPNVVPFLVYIKKEDFHKQRFAVRAKFMTTDPSQNRYISHFDSIRCVQSYLSEGASQHLLPKIDNRNIDRSLETMHQTIFSYLKKLKGRKSMYDESTQKLSFLYSVWKRRKQKITSKSKSLKAIKSMKKAPIEEIYQKQSQISVQSNTLNKKGESFDVNDDNYKNVCNSKGNKEFSENAFNEDHQQMVNSKEIEYKILFDELQAALPAEGKRISSDYMDGNVIQYLKNGSMLMLFETEDENEETIFQLKRKTSSNELRIVGNENPNVQNEPSSVSSSQSSSANLMSKHHQQQYPSILNSGHIVDANSQKQESFIQQTNGSLNNKQDLVFSNVVVENAERNQDSTSFKMKHKIDPKNYEEQQKLNTLNNLNKASSAETFFNNEQFNSSGPSSSGYNKTNSNSFKDSNVPKLGPLGQNLSEVAVTTSMIMHSESQHIINRKPSDIISMSIESESNRVFIPKSDNEKETSVYLMKGGIKQHENELRNVGSIGVNENFNAINNDSTENDNDNDAEFPDTETDMDPAEVTLTDFVETTDSEAVDWKSFLAACGNNYKNFNFNFNIFHQQPNQQPNQQQSNQPLYLQPHEEIRFQLNEQSNIQQPPNLQQLQQNQFQINQQPQNLQQLQQNQFQDNQQKSNLPQRNDQQQTDQKLTIQQQNQQNANEHNLQQTDNQQSNLQQQYHQNLNDQNQQQNHQSNVVDNK